MSTEASGWPEPDGKLTATFSGTGREPDRDVTPALGAALAEPLCVFCDRIAAGEFDYSDRFAVAFEPLRPVTEGHLLVVPREHVPDAGSDPVAAARTMEFAAMIAGPLEFADWHYNLITSAGTAATQTVRHLHIHIVPRREGDGLALPWTGQKERERIARHMEALAANYPEDVFRPGGTSRDATGGNAMRHAYINAARAIRAGEHTA